MLQTQSTVKTMEGEAKVEVWPTTSVGRPMETEPISGDPKAMTESRWNNIDGTVQTK